MDTIDVAQDHIDREMKTRIQTRVTYAGESADQCQNPACGLLISSARQLAVPGCQYCTECAAELERRGRFL